MQDYGLTFCRLLKRESLVTTGKHAGLWSDLLQAFKERIFGNYRETYRIIV